MQGHFLKTMFGFLGLLLVINACAEHKVYLPQDWREPTSSEAKDDWRDKDTGRYLCVKADFNGDGVRDKANILIRSADKKIGVLVFLSQKNGNYRTFILDEMHFSYIEEVGIAVVTPGRYVTWCGMGAMDCRLVGEPEEINLQYNSIKLFFEGKGSKYFYWDKSKDVFKSARISD